MKEKENKENTYYVLLIKDSISLEYEVKASYIEDGEDCYRASNNEGDTVAFIPKCAMIVNRDSIESASRL